LDMQRSSLANVVFRDPPKERKTDLFNL